MPINEHTRWVKVTYHHGPDLESESVRWCLWIGPEPLTWENERCLAEEHVDPTWTRWVWSTTSVLPHELPKDVRLGKVANSRSLIAYHRHILQILGESDV